MEKITADKLLYGLVANTQSEAFKAIVIDGIVTDSRQAAKGKIFVAIKGENVDGHNFIKNAIDAGVELVLAEKLEIHAPANKQILVADSLDAMIKLGENYRSQFSPVLAAVTGSVGKTTTKQFCYAVLSAFGKTLKTEGNQNNEIGMPNTLFRLEGDTKYAIIEMGMQGLGEINKLTMAAKPQAAIITGVGHSHLAQLITRENICKAKMEICDGIAEGGFVVINADDEYLPSAKTKKGISRYSFSVYENKGDVWAKDIKQQKNEQSFVIVDTKYGQIPASIPAIGIHNIYNALAAYTLATRLGLSAEVVAKALQNYQTTGFRQNIVQKNEMTVIEDCYNANPDSMAAAINTLATLEGATRKIVVLGDMLELGSISTQAHMDIGLLCAKNKIDAVYTVGNESKKISDAAKTGGILQIAHFVDKTDCVAALVQFCKKGDAVLFKASRGIKLEEVMQEFYNNLDK